MSYRYFYDVTTCPYCGNDLTAESGVTIEGAREGFSNTLVPSRLDHEGTLEDAFDIVDRGLHSDTLCGKCGESLNAFEDREDA